MAQLVDAPITPSGRVYVSPEGVQNPTAATDPYEQYLTESPVPGSAQGGAAHGPGSGDAGKDDSYYAQFLTEAPQSKAKTYTREVGSGEAVDRGIMHGVTFGLEPSIQGASAAAEPDIRAAAQKFGVDPDTAVMLLNHLTPTLKTLYGAGRTAVDKATGTEDDASKAYDTTRAKEAQANDEAREQHPVLYTGGDIAGALAVPVPGTGAVKVGANVLERIGRGVGEGMIAGGTYGAGNAIGEGKDAREVASDAASGVATGGLLGGTVGGVLGRRPAQVGQTPGQRVAQTAEALGAPLPRGVVSDSPMIQGAAAKMSEVPFAGEKIGERVRNTQTAAANQVEGMASNLVGGEPTRQVAGNSAAPALRQVIEHNNDTIDQAYDALRNQINPDQHFQMPNLQRAIQQIRLRRSRAGWANPGEGLQQAENVANGVGHAGGFNGVHRLRRDLREAGNPQKANPGYDAGDFRYLRRAVDADLRAGVRHVSTDPNRAESLFNTAEMTAGPIIQLNERLEKLAGRHGEAIVGELLGSAKEKGGNIALLRELRRSMDPAAFNQIAGVLLHELGQAEGQSGGFSLSKFATSWRKVSDEAKDLLFSPQHRQWIENIVGMGNHIKDAGRYANTSHTGAFVAVLELAETARELITHGGLNMATAGILATSGGTYLLTHWLASPKTAASMSRWVSTYRALTLNQPAPARIAAFKVATRNLANNINVPFDRIMEIASRQLSNALPAKADEPQKK